MQTCSPNQRTTENIYLESSLKKTCRIMITNFLLSFSIYLVSLSLYTKLAYKVLINRHLIFVANINPVFLSLHGLEAPLYLTLQQLAKSGALPWTHWGLSAPPPPPAKPPAAFYTPMECGRPSVFLFQSLHFQMRSPCPDNNSESSNGKTPVSRNDTNNNGGLSTTFNDKCSIDRKPMKVTIHKENGIAAKKKVTVDMKVFHQKKEEWLK